MTLPSRTMSIFMKLLYPTNQKQKVFSHVIIRHQQYADQIHPGYAKLRRTQARFQVDDGYPVYLKKGLSDKILFGTTVLLCVIGMGMNAMAFYELVCPTQQNSDDEDD